MAPSAAKRLLITRLSAHGDVIQTLPLLGLIKHHAPDTFIGWAVEAAAAPLLQNHPLIDALHVSKRKQWLADAKHPGRWGQVWGESQAWLKEIKAQQYTHSVDVQGLLKSAVIPWLAGVPNRWGFKATREWADRFYAETMPPHNMQDATTPAVIWFARFASVAGVDVAAYEANPTQLPYPLAPVPQQDSHWVDERLALLGALNQPVAVVAPFTIWPSKQWGLARWRQCITTLLAYGYRVVVVGSPNETDSGNALLEGVISSNGAPLWNAIGETSWPQLHALLTKATRFVGHDSAPMHLANAVASNHPQGLPWITAVFGSTGPMRTGPIGPRHTTINVSMVGQPLACQPCFKRHCPLGTTECLTALPATALTAHINTWQDAGTEAPLYE